MDRIKAAEREYFATADAVSRRSRSLRESMGPPPTTTSLRDLDAAADNLGPTYLIRVWAQFESALRSYRRHITGDVDDRIGAKNLIDWTAGVKQGRSISSTVVGDVHQVREYRNHLVHDRDDPSPPPAIPSAGEPLAEGSCFAAAARRPIMGRSDRVIVRVGLRRRVERGSR